MSQAIRENGSIKLESLNLCEVLFELCSNFAFLNAGSINNQAVVYLKFGAAKRISIIRDDIRGLTHICPIDRTEPLNNDECRAAGLHLNSFFLNVSGALDNFAWALLWQINSSEAQELERSGKFTKLGLFKDFLLNFLPSDSSLSKVLKRYSEWDKSLKSKRHPIAHRLPLRVIPQVISGTENINKYKRLQEEWIRDINNFAALAISDDPRCLDEDSLAIIVDKCDEMDKSMRPYLEKQENLCLQMESVGIFVPIFTYSDVLVPLYPTIVDDGKNFSVIAAEVRRFIESIVEV